MSEGYTLWGTHGPRMGLGGSHGAHMGQDRESPCLFPLHMGMSLVGTCELRSLGTSMAVDCSSVDEGSP